MFYTRVPLSNSIRSSIQGAPKKLLTESYWSHVAQAQSPVAGNRCVWKNVFWSYLSKTKHDQVMSMGKLGPMALNFAWDFFMLVPYFGSPCICVLKV